MRRQSIALLISLLMGMPLLLDTASAEPTFRITKKIYGQGRYGDDTEAAPQKAAPAQPAEVQPQPEEKKADQLPANTQEDIQPEVVKPAAPEKAPEPAREAVKPDVSPAASIPAEPLPPVATPDMKPVEAVKEAVKPETTTVLPEKPQQAEEKPDVNIPPVNIPAVKPSRVPTSVKAPQAAVQQAPESVEKTPEIPPMSPEVTPKTRFVDANNQPPHVPTFAEKVESLQPAKNEELFKEALKHYNAATRLGQQGKFKEAVVEYQKALYIHPAFPDARVGLAVSYASLGQWLPMINELEMSLQLKDLFLDQFNLVQAHYNLGAAYCVQGNTKRAKTELDIVKEAKHPNIKQLEMFIQSHCTP